jgi:hypothetical protein
MEAHEALERFEKVSEHGHGGLDRLARDAAIFVAVVAALLAVATFLSNEAVKEVITGETQAADVSARLEANDVKIAMATNNNVLLEVLAAGLKGNPKEALAIRHAEALDARVRDHLVPIDRRLAAIVRRDEEHRDRADNQHLLYELSQVGFQLAIVLAGISIIARRRWLLAGGGLAGTAGTALLVSGFIY